MYASTEYAPALARLRNAGHERALSLQQAILGVNERRDTLAQQIYQQEQDRAFQAEQARLAREAQERQAAAARASAAAAAQPTLDLQRQFSQEQERAAALQAEVERVQKQLQAAQNYRPGYSRSKQPQLYGVMVPNF